MELSFKVADYEGPLDLLLTLIARHKIDILDINISELLKQYLEEMEKLDKTDMDTASSFLEMASRLVYIKTVSLLPKHEEETEQLKSELSGQLLEYQLCKEVAAMLSQLYVGGDIFIREPQKVETSKEYTATMPVSELLSAYIGALGKKQRRLPPPRSAFSGIVKQRVVSVSSRIIHIMKRLYGSGTAEISSIMDSCTDRSEMVVTFLAMLELIKSGRIEVDDEGENMRLTGRETEPLSEEDIMSDFDIPAEAETEEKTEVTV
ncbi:MAG: segregation/condensation protein A [Oscillospiraceae bacterium]|nr:segregation/condensation protein A [Oscillospiraceae bacterium]